jgi:two-component SAPR family response regulator
MSYNVVVVDDDEIILLLHNKIIQEVAQDSPKTFNSAHKALTFSIAF